MRTPRRLVHWTAVVGVTVAIFTAVTHVAGAGTAPPPVPETGAYLGLWNKPAPDATWSDTVAAWARRETAAGRTYDIGHYYRNFGQGKSDILGGWQAQFHVDAGRIPMVSWNGGGQRIAEEIVDGKHDAGIRTAARDLRDLDAPLFLRFWWEMDADGMSPASYIGAWRHVHDVFAAEGVGNAAWVWCPNAWDWHGSARGAGGKHFYPGADYVDWVCADGYNWYPGKSPNQPNESFATIFDPFYDWSEAIGKPILIGEFGAMEFAGEHGTPVNATGKADWIRDAAATIRTRYPQVKAVVYFDEDATVVHGHHDWSLDSSAASLDAWNTAFAADPYYDPRAPGAPQVPDTDDDADVPDQPDGPPPPDAGRASMLFVAGSTQLNAGDEAVVARLRSAGHSVAVVADENADAAKAADRDLVLVSSSTSSLVVGRRLTDVAVPILTWKPWLYDDLLLTPEAEINYGSHDGQAELRVVDTDHPLTDGLGTSVAIADPPKRMAYGLPSSGDVVATLVSGESALFTFSPGDTLADGSAAPACRVAFPSFHDTPTAFTAAGWSLFDATVDWATGGCVGATHTSPPPPPPTTQPPPTTEPPVGEDPPDSAEPGGDRIQIRVTGALSYAVDAEIIDGDIRIGNEHGLIDNITGSATIPGANGGTATIGLNVDAAVPASVLTGILYLTDTSAGVSLRSVIVGAEAKSPQPGVVNWTATWFDFGSMPMRRYRIDVTVTDAQWG